MDAVGMIVLGLAVALGAALAVLVQLAAGRGIGSGEGIAELRGRIDALLETQRDLPRAVAEGGAIQAESLAGVRERLAEVLEATRRLESIGTAIAELERVFQVPKLRGTFGEVWLAELLGQVLPAQRYDLEYRFRSGERVDAVVRLRDQLLPIDAKFPLEACQRMLQAEGETAERERRAFARTLRARVDEIAEKYIRPDEGTSGFALMYVPAERAYYEAVLRNADAIAEYARSRNVLLVSPTTFFAYLSALAHGFRGLEVEEHARVIVERLAALRLDLDRVRATLDVLGRHLSNAAKQHDEATRGIATMAARLSTEVSVESAPLAGPPRAPDHPIQ